MDTKLGPLFQTEFDFNPGIDYIPYEVRDEIIHLFPNFDVEVWE